MQIKIRLDDPRQGYSVNERDLSVIPTVAHVDQTDTVEWMLEGTDTQSFIIFFQNETPVGKVEVHGRRAGAGEAIKSQPLSLKGAPPRVYRYAVAVATNTGVFLDAACPEFIVR